jgi:hypothetical protein
VEPDFSVFFVVEVVDGRSVRVSVVPDDGKHTAFFLFKDPETFLLRKCLMGSSHFPKHGNLLKKGKGSLLSPQKSL